jgi:3-oxoadipate enol-lactonase
MKITANGIGMNYTLEGPAQAPMLTLSHSLAADLTMWDPQMAVLTAKYRVLSYDTRGHGKTDAPAGGYTLDQLADDALALLDALGIQKTHWMGLSMGGMIGQTLALKAPERLSSLILCDTSSRIPPDAKPLWDDRIRTAETQGMKPLVDGTVARWFTEPFRKQGGPELKRIEALIAGTNPRGYAGCCHAIAGLNLTDRIGAIKLPTLIVVGEEDQGTPVAASRTINEQIKGSELAILKSASHLSNVEQPAAFTKAVTDFLAKVAR